MNYYVYGAGKIGKKLKSRAAEYNIPISGFIDSYKTTSTPEYNIVDLSVIDPTIDAVIISVLNTNSILDIYQKLRAHKIKHIYWYYDAFQNLNEKKNFLSEQCLDLSNWGNLIMPHIELHISDACNLNCKGCSHFSPLFDDINADFNSKMSDIHKIKNLFDDIFRIDILGGEPLLNPELERYVYELRKELPNTFIQIYTNGLLIPKLSETVLKTIRDSNVGISISEYLPTHKMISRIRTILDQYQIRYHIAEYDSKMLFNTPVSIAPNSKHPRLCISNGCITIADGKVSRCPTLMYIEKFNSYFHQNLPTEGIYRIDSYSDGQTLLDDMRKDVPLCNHCIEKPIKWEPCHPTKKLSDFAAED